MLTSAMRNIPSPRTCAQRRRQDSYYPDTMSPNARHLARMREIAAFWAGRAGPHGNAFDAAGMIAIADAACRELAAGIIGNGCAR